MTRYILQDINNAHATFGTGIVSLGIFSFLLVLVNAVLAYRNEKKPMYAAKSKLTNSSVRGMQLSF